LENYKTTARFITTELDFGALLVEHFHQLPQEISPNICLTGLHTCGNLAATCLQVFHARMGNLNSGATCLKFCKIGKK